MSKLKKELDAPIHASDGVMGSVRYRAEWERQQERQKRKEEEAKEKERVAYASIDWHDFVVVETVRLQFILSLRKSLCWLRVDKI